MKNCKKFWISIMIVCLAMGLSACDKEKKDSTTATNPVEPYADMIDDVNGQVSEEYEDMENVMDNLDEYQ